MLFVRNTLTRRDCPYDHPCQWAFHSYADFYERLFQHCKVCIKNVFKCGIDSNDPNVPQNMGVNGKPGASLREWRDYSRTANIVGADMDKNILF
jgi:hypothetical protein